MPHRIIGVVLRGAPLHALRVEALEVPLPTEVASVRFGERARPINPSANEYMAVISHTLII